MITFPYLRTRRLAVRLAEMTMDESIGVARLPADRPEMTNTVMLRAAAKNAEQPTPAFVTDPRLWTVQERALVVCTYLAQVSPDGPDFAVGPGRLSDYIDFTADAKMEQAALGEVCGKPRVMRHLLGAHVEVLEAMCKSLGDWTFGAMACQVFERDEVIPAWGEMSNVQLMDWVKTRMEALRKLPESDFEALHVEFSLGRVELYHFFELGFGTDGVAFLPREREEGGAATAPAKFHASTCISGIARAMA